MPLPVRLLSVGSHTPAVRVTSAELDQRYARTPGTTQARSGVSVRQWVGPDDSSVSMAAAALDQTKLFQRRQAGQGLAGVFRPCGCKQRLQIIRKHIAGAHHAIHGSGIGTGGQAGQPLVIWQGRSAQESIKPCGLLRRGIAQTGRAHGAAMAGHHRPAAPLEDADFHRGIHSCTHAVGQVVRGGAEQ